MGPPPRSTRAQLGRLALMTALIVGLYYLVPVERGVSGLQLWLRIAGTVVLGVLITWQIVRQTRRQITEASGVPVVGLLTAIVGGVTFLALADFVVAISIPGQFEGMNTKTDALYFALATLTTVGYGDVYAAGQLARAVVIIQLVFNVVVIATAGTVLTRTIRARVQDHKRH